MVGVRKSSRWTRSDDIAGVESCHIVLEPSPPDYVKKISRYLDSSVGPDEVSNEAAGADSDSGDSLFITQKQVPEAVRSGRRKHHSERSKPISPRDIEGSDGGTSSSDSHEDSKNAKDERYKEKFSVTSLPKFSFPFLSRRRGKGKARSTQLSSLQNKALHNAAMGGFFKCLIEDYKEGYDVQSTLPTVDVEGEYISPLSEEEEEWPEDEDIKVVERKRFVFLSKAKSQQTWCNSLKQQRRKADNPRQETSQGGRHKTAKGSVTREKPLSTNTDGSDDGVSSCGVLVERGRNKRCIISDGNFLAQKETPKKNRRSPRRNKKILFQQKATEEELCNDSDATVCEPPELQSSPRQHTHIEEETTTAAEPQTPVLHTDDLSESEQTEDEPASQSLLCNLPDIVSDINNDRVKKRKKKKKDKGAHESVEEEEGQSREEPEGLHAAVQETAGLSVDNSAGPPAAQTTDELEVNGRNYIENSHAQEEGGIPDSKQKKKKRKKDQSLAENVGQEVDGNLESDVRTADSVFSVNVENDGEEDKKKKKKKKRKINGEDVEQLQSSTVAEAPNDDAVDDAVIKKKKKKRKKESPSQDGEEGVDVSLCNGAATSEDGTGTSPKKKKTTSDEVIISYTPEEKEKVDDEDYTQETKEGLEDQNTELVTKKKKKKKKKSERSGWTITEDNVTQSDDSVSVQEKEKKRTSSFLVADVKENNARTHEEQNGSSQSVDAEKPVGAGDFQTESAEIARNSLESNDGVRKKKKKRKMSVEQGSVEKEHKQDFEDANKTKEKKKRVRNESESVNTVERYQNAADEGYSQSDEDAVVKKKKKCKRKLCLVTATEDAESEKSTLITCSSKEIEQASQETCETSELEPQENKKKRKKERNKQSSDPKIISSSPMLSETLISVTEKSPVVKNKHTKVKRRLLNGSEDFL